MFLMNCVVLISSHLVPHNLSLKFLGIGQERVLSMVYVVHSCSMCHRDIPWMVKF